MARRNAATARPTGVARPPPNTVRCNDWQALPVAAPDTFEPLEPVTVVVPYYEAPTSLAVLLAGLERQTYPRHLIEVVVVDDGSPTPLEAPPSALELRLIRQESRHFALAQARNTGVRNATADIVVFLDGDMVPDAGLIAEHARWHHAVADALTLGFRCRAPRHLDPGAVRRHPGPLAGLLATRPLDGWREHVLARTSDLRSRHDWPFVAMVGANFAIRKTFYEALGGSDESFVRYGGEDTELAYRAYTQGGVLVPARRARAWHQGPPGPGAAARRDRRRAQAAKLANLIAHRFYRHRSRARAFTVPRRTVTVRATGCAATVAAAVDGLLADAHGDTVVRIDTAAVPVAAVRWLDEYYAADPAVRVAPLRAALDDFPATPLHADIDTAATTRGLLAHLERHLGQAAMATLRTADGSHTWLARAWVLHRARRTGRAPAALGDVVAAPPPPRRAGRRRAAPHWPPTGLAAALRRIAAEARHVRGPRTARAFTGWLGRGIRERATRPRPRAARAPARPRDDDAFGAALATAGERAARVFAAAPQIPRHPAGARPDVVLADAAATAPRDVPAVLLTDHPRLATPAFAPRTHNPMRWRRIVEQRAVALGPQACLGPDAPRTRPVAPHDWRALADAHRVVDVAAFHRDVDRRAGTLVRLAAAGVPVHVLDADTDLAIRLGPELAALMADDLAGAGTDRRESASIRQRRAALRDHTLRARVRQVAAVALADPPAPPQVSVLLATRRPALLAAAVANVARQNYPNLELVLALHGDDFDDPSATLAGLACPVTVLRVGASRVLGSVLNAAAAAARGLLVTKMDDDDLYAADHVWDLVLAREYAAAEVVGKGLQHVYLADADCTVTRHPELAETYSSDLAGGTLLIARHDLERLGGWPRTPRAVDSLLIEAALQRGWRVYRTHAAGFLMVRHGDGHTWPEASRFFLDSARIRRPGWRPDAADCPAGDELAARLPPGPAGIPPHP